MLIWFELLYKRAVYGLFFFLEDYQELIEDIVRDGRLYASENHQEILKVCTVCTYIFIQRTDSWERMSGDDEGQARKVPKLNWATGITII